MYLIDNVSDRDLADLKSGPEDLKECPRQLATEANLHWPRELNKSLTSSLEANGSENMLCESVLCFLYSSNSN